MKRLNLVCAVFGGLVLQCGVVSAQFCATPSQLDADLTAGSQGGSHQPLGREPPQLS